MPLRQLCLLLALGASSALRRFPEEEDLPPDVSFFPEEEDLPDLGEGPDEPQAKIRKRHLQLRDTPFKNVLLVVHCRLTDIYASRVAGEPRNATAICNKRLPLFQNLEQFFPEVVFWRGGDCSVGGASPHNCIAEQLLESAALRDGIFYMHFDALVRPEVMKHSIDLKAIGTFNEHQQCDADKGCDWHVWRRWKEEVMASVDASAAKGFPVEKETFWLGEDDLFYMPKAIFPAYRELVKLWCRVHHEAAGPTMWRILGRYANVSVVSLGCRGGCCFEVPGSEALADGFRCGHPFRLNNAYVRKAFTQAQLMG